MALMIGASALWVLPRTKAPLITGSFVGTPLSSLRSQKLVVSCKRKRRLSARVRAGLPIISSVPVVGPLVNVLLSPLVLLAVYAFGAFKFLSGYSKTTYADSLSSKLGLTILWPVLFVVSQKYRGNFNRAVQ
ncbi:hypothetical protein GOP47_0027976 [Adiantum capillus-veneris]|nr:hypothetical protein GOP47_0027976 [Adiantum capillus-veneris]